MHLKRNVGATKAPLSNISPTAAPPIPTKPMNETAAASPPPPPPPPKPSPEKHTLFKNTAFGKSSKLAALEASGSSNYVLVSSPIVCAVYEEQGLCSLLYFFGTLSLSTIILLQVGTFRRGRTVKGKKQPSICKEVLVSVSIVPYTLERSLITNDVDAVDFILPFPCNF